MWIIYDGVRTPFVDQALRSSIAITGLPPRIIDAVIEEVKERIRTMGGVVEREELVSIVEDLLSPYGVEDRYRVWEKYRELRRSGEYDRPLIMLISGASGTGKSIVATDIIGRFAITRIYSTDSIRQLVRTTHPKPTVMVHTWEAKDYLTDEDVERLRALFGEQSMNIYGYLDQSLWVVEKGVKPLLERLNREGANALVEGVHLLPGVVTGENVAFAVIEVPYEVHRAFIFVKSRRAELKDVGRDPRRREEEFRLIREVHDFLVREAKKRGVPVIRFTNYGETVKGFIDIIYDTVRGIVDRYG